MAESVLAPVRPVFRAIATTVVPEAARLDGAGWAELEATVERQLSARPASLRRQLQLLIRALEWLAVVRFGHRFTALSGARRTRFLDSVQNSPIYLLRRGFWGLRTLVFLGYYTRPEVAADIGYRADPRGWESRG